MSGFNLPELPPIVDLETKTVLKQLSLSHRYLAELKGVARTIPNQSILIQTLPLLEAKDSSAIENIVTTHDELYRMELLEEAIQDSAAKEVQNYRTALRYGFEIVKGKSLLTNNLILEIQKIVKKQESGFRALPGTDLKNFGTGEVIYTPPQRNEDIVRLMNNLEKVINEEEFYPVDPLVKMAVIHYQFESIHPFYDGNGRTGRIINILYLVLNQLLDIPILYLSRYIIQTKEEYYNLLQSVRDSGNWEQWVLYILKGVEETSKNTIVIIQSIKELMDRYKKEIRTNYKKIYSQDLLNNLFKHPYTKIDFLEKDLGISRQTASKYLDALADGGYLKKEKIGRNNLYINVPLYEIFLKN
ncbi:MAG: Fic family protein [Leptospiraceae bacterium]|nr:Fic family protein [Leptospiraceae bacterium]